MDAIDEIVAAFLVESHENLDQLDRDLLALEQDPGSGELLARVFRTIHTIKGTSGSLAFHRLEEVTHVGENLLSRLRDGTVNLTQGRASALLRMVDAVRGLLVGIEQTGQEGDADVTELVAQLSALLEDGALARVPAQSGAPAAEAGAPRRAARRSVVDGSVRVDVELLDTLTRLVRELVLARDQLISLLDGALDGEQDAALDGAREDALARSAQRLSLVTDELQEQVTRTRMQPVDSLWSKMPRIVRDLATRCGRRVRLEMVGGDTELDRSLLEALRDPLTHLVRNAVDHGLEDPEVREAAGKNPEGLLTLRARRDARHVHLEIIDDGAGIDPQKIGARAVERGLISLGRVDRMTDRELLQLVFLPGLTTAVEITNVSGRGVGLDVVKTRIEGIGGSVDVVSTVGEGSTVHLTVPLTPRPCRR